MKVRCVVQAHSGAVFGDRATTETAAWCCCRFHRYCISRFMRWRTVWRERTEGAGMHLFFVRELNRSSVLHKRTAERHRVTIMECTVCAAVSCWPYFGWRQIQFWCRVAATAGQRLDMLVIAVELASRTYPPCVEFHWNWILGGAVRCFPFEKWCGQTTFFPVTTSSKSSCPYTTTLLF